MEQLTPKQNFFQVVVPVFGAVIIIFVVVANLSINGSQVSVYDNSTDALTGLPCRDVYPLLCRIKPLERCNPYKDICIKHHECLPSREDDQIFTCQCPLEGYQPVGCRKSVGDSCDSHCDVLSDLKCQDGKCMCPDVNHDYEIETRMCLYPVQKVCQQDEDCPSNAQCIAKMGKVDPKVMDEEDFRTMLNGANRKFCECQKGYGVDAWTGHFCVPDQFRMVSED